MSGSPEHTLTPNLMPQAVELASMPEAVKAAYYYQFEGAVNQTMSNLIASYPERPGDGYRPAAAAMLHQQHAEQLSKTADEYRRNEALTTNPATRRYVLEATEEERANAPAKLTALMHEADAGKQIEDVKDLESLTLHLTREAITAHSGSEDGTHPHLAQAARLLVAATETRPDFDPAVAGAKELTDYLVIQTAAERLDRMTGRKTSEASTNVLRSTYEDLADMAAAATLRETAPQNAPAQPPKPEELSPKQRLQKEVEAIRGMVGERKAEIQQELPAEQLPDRGYLSLLATPALNNADIEVYQATLETLKGEAAQRPDTMPHTAQFVDAVVSSPFKVSTLKELAASISGDQAIDYNIDDLQKLLKIRVHEVLVQYSSTISDMPSNNLQMMTQILADAAHRYPNFDPYKAGLEPLQDRYVYLEALLGLNAENPPTVTDATYDRWRETANRTVTGMRKSMRDILTVLSERK